MKKEDFDKMNLVNDGTNDIHTQLIGETIHIKGVTYYDNTSIDVKVLEIKQLVNAAAYLVVGEVSVNKEAYLHDKGVYNFLSNTFELYDQLEKLNKAKSLLRSV